ncbi:hypothetical protein [Levilactobacillus bambusae]|uniref:Uncharacterized protein n=1 Tax=Levilactobacillus bambusae TaxID=2024736 RepID=A0A2V1N148_9LACO|nr:hypothetical protein [Levilactobacillus bambusae]PWG00989.1 hypothetical protein DCM90_02105 [Levilactobacillus bambusae]
MFYIFKNINVQNITIAISAIGLIISLVAFLIRLLTGLDVWNKLSPVEKRLISKTERAKLHLYSFISLMLVALFCIFCSLVPLWIEHNPYVFIGTIIAIIFGGIAFLVVEYKDSKSEQQIYLNGYDENLYNGFELLTKIDDSHYTIRKKWTEDYETNIISTEQLGKYTLSTKNPKNN